MLYYIGAALVGMSIIIMITAFLPNKIIVRLFNISPRDFPPTKFQREGVVRVERYDIHPVELHIDLAIDERDLQYQLQRQQLMNNIIDRQMIFNIARPRINELLSISVHEFLQKHPDAIEIIYCKNSNRERGYEFEHQFHAKLLIVPTFPKRATITP